MGTIPPMMAPLHGDGWGWDGVHGYASSVSQSSKGGHLAIEINIDHLIAEAFDRRLGSREPGLVVRRIADEGHVGRDGQPRLVSLNTLDRWIRSYRRHRAGRGFVTGPVLTGAAPAVLPG